MTGPTEQDWSQILAAVTTGKRPCELPSSDYTALNDRVTLADEKLHPDFGLTLDPTEGVMIHDEDGEPLVGLPEWAISEDVETAVLVALAIGTAYRDGWIEGYQKGRGDKLKGREA